MIRKQSMTGLSVSRRGATLPLVALTIVALTGFLGLGIDIGMLVVARGEVQNAADLAALTAARTLTGDSTNNYNQSNATTNAQNILSYNTILGQSIQSSQLQLTYGSYDYDQDAQTFSANFPPTTGKPVTAVTATVTSNNLPTAFGAVFGIQFFSPVSATSTAVHRPRDIALVMDLSGSMRMGTCLGYDFWTSSRTTNNPDSLYPTFGHYSSNSSGLQGTSSNRSSSYDGYTISPSNTTAPNTSYSLTYVNNFYSNAPYASTLIRAFDSCTSTDGGVTWSAPSSGTNPSLPPSSYTSTPGGDVPLYANGSTTNYAKTVNNAVNGTSRNKWWELDGYSGCASGSFNNADLGTSSYASGSFNAYTQGPGYYGKTFFLWPPDPRQPLTTANNSTQINQFLQDFGYTTSADFANAAFTTTLSARILNTTQTSISVTSSTPFPISGLPSTTFRIIVGTEIMLVTAASGTGNITWTVQRGMDGTTAASHSSGSTVGLVTGPPLYGIYGVTTTSGSQNWPWPNDNGSTLSSYLTNNVYISVSAAGSPATARLLQTTDAAYQKIMRLYNWNYVVDTYNSAGSGISYPGTTPCDWRVRFFGTNDNTKLFKTNTGTLNLPGNSTYTINYNEILRWLTASPNPFPQQLRAGRIKYYGSIPTQITGSWPSYGSKDQRFWKEFIDYVLGFQQTGSSTYQDVSAMAGYGSDFTWGSVSINSPPGATQYMNYSDNPARPLLRYWFGPMAMVDYLHNMNMSEQQISGFYLKEPGDGYEAPLYSGKQAFLAAINTMQMNHPNDWFTVICYSWPRSSSNGTAVSGLGYGRFNCVRSPLGPNYNYALSSLLFPFSTINADGTCNNSEITPYDADPATSSVPSADLVDTPRGDGDTCFAMGLMLAYNQFATTSPSDSTLRSFVSSSPITFPTGMAGGMGRKGAQKVIIFETDGLANTTATASLVNAGSYKYYQIRYDMNKPSSSEYPSVTTYGVNNSTVLNQVYSLVQQLASDCGTSRNPFRLYAIGFGPVFSGTNSTAALQTLQTMQYYAGTQSSAATALSSDQIITGTDAQMLTKMTNTFTNILENGVQITIIK
ncbi:MAG TPA: pilus assembly protein TadG-related protein [Gemmataceae bacterium]|jgi:Flp pilus assembly protein TadG